jgi:hypothetical protein
LNNKSWCWITALVRKLKPGIFVCLAAASLGGISGCNRASSITFLEVPSASSGGIGKTARIRGQVSGRHRGRHIVLYAFADGRWWVQPFASTPRTEIADDGSWKAQIHLGTEYAALLTTKENLPSQYLETLPIKGKGIEAVATIKASGDDDVPAADASNEKTLRFSGLDWKVRVIPGDYGAKTNEYSPDNVFVDAGGELHLRLSRSAHGWMCSEVHSVRSFGYGDYTLAIRDVAHLEPAVMFSTFTFFERPLDGDHRELAIHITRRGVASNTNAEFSIQPAFVPTNFYHFEVPSGALKLGLTWHKDEARFSVSSAQTPASPPLTAWLFKTGVPRSDDTHLYINLCSYGYAPAPPTHNAEVVVKKFEFYP